MAQRVIYPAGSPDSYVYGSAVRAPEVQIPAPERREREERRTDYEVRRDAAKLVEQKVVTGSGLLRSFSPVQVVLLTMSALLLIAAAAFYTMQASGHYRAKKALAQAEEQAGDLREENALMENRLEEEIDYEGVYEFAVANGMRTPEKQQVITYTRITKEYVTKNGEIPNE